MPASKRILIIAGPNGAGKTTFATEFLPNEAGCPTFINADLIAAGLNPFQPERSAVRAGRMMLTMIDDYVRRGESFAFETTLSGRGFPRMIPQWQAQGYQILLYFDCLRLRWRWPGLGFECARAVTTFPETWCADDTPPAGATFSRFIVIPWTIGYCTTPLEQPPY